MASEPNPGLAGYRTLGITVCADRQPRPRRLRNPRWLVVRRWLLVAGQQLPPSAERVADPPAVGQHPDDAQDPRRALVRLVARGLSGRPADPATLIHRAAGEARFLDQPVPSNGKPREWNSTSAVECGRKCRL